MSDLKMIESDIEEKVNGLLTYDRRVIKVKKSVRKKSR